MENLFGAAELAAKAYLLCYGHQEYAGKVKHGSIHAHLNRQRHIGNVPKEPVEVFNRLHDSRGKARYVEEIFSVAEADAKEYLKYVGDLIELAVGYAEP